MTTYMIEACNDDHGWDSDYVGNESYTDVEAARAAVRDLEHRSDHDPADPDKCSDGVSWRGWVFRILQSDDDDAYTIEVD